MVWKVKSDWVTMDQSSRRVPPFMPFVKCQRVHTRRAHLPPTTCQRFICSNVAKFVSRDMQENLITSCKKCLLSVLEYITCHVAAFLPTIWLVSRMISCRGSVKADLILTHRCFWCLPRYAYKRTPLLEVMLVLPWEQMCCCNSAAHAQHTLYLAAEARCFSSCCRVLMSKIARVENGEFGQS